MSAAEREELLADAHVGVLSAAAGTADLTLAVPVWVQLPAGRAADGTDRPVRAGHPPYRHVSAEGPIVSEEEPDPAERLAMARRHLGAAGGNRHIADNPDPRREACRSGCARSTGSARIRAGDNPKGNAPWQDPMCGNAGYAPLPPRESTANSRSIGRDCAPVPEMAWPR
jgi:hypothetical protein